MAIRVRPAAESDVREFITWRYDHPYDDYNITGDAKELVAYFLSAAVDCHVLMEDHHLVGFCTFGADAQVPGGDYLQNRLDVGLGVRPDLTGQGNGRAYVLAVIAEALQRSPQLRVTIAQGNVRAMKVWEASGFVPTQHFESEVEVLGTRDFVILTKDS